MFTPKPLKLLVLTGCIALFGCTPAADPGGSGGTGSGTGGSSGGRGGSGTGGTSGGSSGGSTGGSTGGSSSSGGSGGSSSGGNGGSSSGGSGGSVAGSGGSSSGGSGGSGGSSSDSSGGGTGGAGGSGGSSGDGGMATETPSTGGPFPPGPHNVVLITGDDAHLNDPSRLQMIELLKSMQGSHGIVYEEIDANMVRAANMMGKALLIASPNANYFGVTPEAALRNLPVPIIVSKDGNTDVLGLGNTGNTDSNQDSIRIIATDHPIVAGFQMGLVKVMTTNNLQRMVQFTGVGPGGKRLATVANNPNQFTIVAYDKGADMGGGLNAPAKRVGFFWHRPAGPTPDGAKLFKAAVEWAIRP